VRALFNRSEGIGETFSPEVIATSLARDLHRGSLHTLVNE
jgi:SpoVK/Ycf46/Vps4 family AAA+-type ATPase